MSDDVRPDLVRRAVDLALDNVAAGGKPFACLVVDATTGETLHEATNQVAQTGDVTAHAEITAIRDLAARGRTDLTGCEVYVTAYPCPMCLGALYYAAPDRVVFAATREQEGAHYEDGGRYMSLATFYDEYARDPADRALPSVHGESAGTGPHPDAGPDADPDARLDVTAPFRAWTEKHGAQE